MKIEIYDTTLRDGAQGAGINFTLEDETKVICALDKLGIDFIELSGYNDLQAYELLKPTLTHSKFVLFGNTRRACENVCDDSLIAGLADSSIETVAVFGKSWLFHVANILRTTPEENLNMISDTVDYLKAKGKNVIYDAEHFFDGYSDNPSYALKTVETAYNAGADTVVLCDTNGGMLPDVIGMAVSAVKSAFPELKIGIHCHNDMGMAVAGAVEAVISGAVQVQGTVSGIGERCGNTNLNTVIPLMRYRLGFDCLTPEHICLLTQTTRYINEIANLTFNENEPFVGGYAFTHKAGTHIDAMRKSSKSFEHIVPELVGNERNLLLSGLSGRAAILERMLSEYSGPRFTKDSPEVKSVLELIKKRVNSGYSYEDAEASLALVIREALNARKKHFNLIKYQVNINETDAGGLCTALIKIEVDGQSEITAAEGEGPVNALDTALRKALSRFYPVIETVRLTDYKVRVLNSGAATASKVRVLIETTDGTKVWRTVGVSSDIIDASWQALTDALEYKLHMPASINVGSEGHKS